MPRTAWSTGQPESHAPPRRMLLSPSPVTWRWLCDQVPTTRYDQVPTTLGGADHCRTAPPKSFKAGRAAPAAALKEGHAPQVQLLKCNREREAGCDGDMPSRSDVPPQPCLKGRQSPCTSASPWDDRAQGGRRSAEERRPSVPALARIARVGPAGVRAGK